MVDDDIPFATEHRIGFRRVRELRWEAYAVHCHQTRIGFVTRLPEGVWLAYLPVGISSSGWSSREAAAEALHIVAATPRARPARQAAGALQQVAAGNRAQR